MRRRVQERFYLRDWERRRPPPRQPQQPQQQQQQQQLQQQQQQRGQLRTTARLPLRVWAAGLPPPSLTLQVPRPNYIGYRNCISVGNLP